MKDMIEWIREADPKLLDKDIPILETQCGIKYSVLPNSDEYAYDRFIVYKGSEAPVVYTPGTPQEVHNLRIALNTFLDDDGDLKYDVMIHCRKEHFEQLMKVDS